MTADVMKLKARWKSAAQAVRVELAAIIDTAREINGGSLPTLEPECPACGSTSEWCWKRKPWTAPPPARYGTRGVRTWASKHAGQQEKQDAARAELERLLKASMRHRGYTRKAIDAAWDEYGYRLVRDAWATEKEALR